MSRGERRAPFPYPGGKTKRSKWIVNRFPKHHAYVEVFGGSASVLVNKPRSTVQVYNDADGDLVHFFETLRDRTDKLREWIRLTPFSRELYKEYVTDYYNGVRPDDDVERAGRFFYLRFTQFGAKYDGPAGFGTDATRNNALTMSNTRKYLSDVADLFDDVVVECLDFAELIDRYDRPETFFYCDPLYTETDGHYGGEFDHSRLWDCLEGADGRWAVSLDCVPERLSDYQTDALDRGFELGSGKNGGATEDTERLIMNYDLNNVPNHSPDSSLDEW